MCAKWPTGSAVNSVRLAQWGRLRMLDAPKQMHSPSPQPVRSELVVNRFSTPRFVPRQMRPQALSEPSPISFEPRSPVDAALAGMRDLETAVALTTHQCAALAAGVQATINQAIADLNAAVASAEARLERSTSRAVELIERASTAEAQIG
jgi:hypothetical protein